MPEHTESRIMDLISQALAAKSEAEVDRVLPNLRFALREHIRLAKESLEAQATALHRPQPKKP